MHTTSLELCKELFELSRWDETDENWLPDKEGKYEIRGGPWYNKNPRIPAYDLGYLLRKLPIGVQVKSVDRFSVRKYTALYDAYRRASDVQPNRYFTEQETTPEDAVCRLAIELFQQGIL